MKNKIIYCAMCADILHNGHINILKRASRYGQVIVGLLTDRAIKKYKTTSPILNYNQRKLVLISIRYVYKIISQNTLSYIPNLKKIKPDFVIHGNDWRKGTQSKTRKDVINFLKKYNGKLIEPKYTANISSSIIKKKLRNKIYSLK